jgi:hypothetical protein
VEPEEETFTGFVFKIQANMDPQHRDRIAFLRICSGSYQPGIKVRHVRLGREVKIADALTFMAAEREHAEAGYPGDIIGLHNHGTIRIGDTFWLRVPVGKLHNDRYVPLHPILVELITDYRHHRGPSSSGMLLERNDAQPFDRRTIARYVAAVAKRAGVGHVHPHQLRHTLATQAINRGMSLEAIAALLGHRTMRMTLVYARISDRTVADEYFRVTEAVEASYRTSEPVPATAEGTNLRRLAADHRRLLGNGHCTRPAALDCNFETICERCGFFDTGPQFIPILRRQRDHSIENDQHDRAAIFNGLLDGIDNQPPGMLE